MKVKIREKMMIFLLAGAMFAFLTGCAAKHCDSDKPEDLVPAKLTLDARSDTKYMIDAYDPLECFNRRMYNFNYYFDTYFFLPVVSGYAFITPDYIEYRITNFFQNLREVKNLTNCLLQLKAEDSGITLGRFLVNSTIGLVGFYDPATDFGWLRRNEDFGQTLGYWNVGAGPYVVLPVFGPSTCRDTAGLLFDGAVKSVCTDAALDNAESKSAILAAANALNAIDARHRVSFRYYKSGSPFEYDLVRRLYLDLREIQIAK
ncbi:MAG: VacJ family lipoprotein [Desulfobacteraceae bacterium]|nr:MAG: VacJ family lipoprotein [Desulfobacteraceae bacterium]